MNSDSAVFVRALLLMAAEKLSHQEATQPRAAHCFSADQHADETMIFVAPALVFLTAFLLLGAASFLEAITEQVRHHQAAKAAATHHSGAYQEAHQLAFLLARTFFGSFFAFLGGLAAFLATLVQQMGQQETAQAPTPHHAASDQQAHETALFSGAALEFAFLALALLGAFFHAVVEDCRHEETAQSTPMQTAANQQTCKAVFFLTAFLAFVLAFGPFK